MQGLGETLPSCLRPAHLDPPQTEQKSSHRLRLPLLCPPADPLALPAGFAGTPGYLSPEVLRKDPYGKPVDMWACGKHPGRFGQRS